MFPVNHKNSDAALFIHHPKHADSLANHSNPNRLLEITCVVDSNYFQYEGTDDQFFDEELVSLIRKTDDDFVLLSERNQPVESSEEDY